MHLSDVLILQGFLVLSMNHKLIKFLINRKSNISCNEKGTYPPSPPVVNPKLKCKCNIILDME